MRAKTRELRIAGEAAQSGAGERECSLQVVAQALARVGALGVRRGTALCTRTSRALYTLADDLAGGRGRCVEFGELRFGEQQTRDQTRKVLGATLSAPTHAHRQVLELRITRKKGKTIEERKIR